MGGGGIGYARDLRSTTPMKVFASGVVLHISYFFVYFVSILLFFSYEDQTVLLLYKICFAFPARHTTYYWMGNRKH